MLEKRKENYFYLVPVIMVNLNLPKDYRLMRDLLPPNIRQAWLMIGLRYKKVHDMIKKCNE